MNIVLGCVIACDCLIKCFYSSLPCLLVWLSCIWFFSFSDDHQFIDVSRCKRHSRSTGEGMISLHSLLGLDLGLLGLFFRTMTRVPLVFRLKIINVDDLYFILCYGIVVCPFLIRIFSWIV